MLAHAFIDADVTFINAKLFSCLSVNIEPISVVFLATTSCLWFITNLYACFYLKAAPDLNSTKLHFFIGLSIFCTFGIGVAGNLLTTFVFYELLTIFTYPLVARIGGNYKSEAVSKYLLLLLFTSMVLFLPAVITILHLNGNTTFAEGGIMGAINGVTSTILLVMFLYGVAKTAIIPMHSWLPDAMVAPIPVSALLHSVAVVNSGVFIILKIIVYIFGVKYLDAKVTRLFGVNLMTILCSLSVIVSSIVAIYQTSLKRLLAYSTINQLSICLLIASLFNPHAIKAAVVHMVAHAVSKINLFFATGNMMKRHNTTDIKDLKGLSQEMPFTALVFLISGLSIIGIPIFAGFVSKAYILFAALDMWDARGTLLVVMTLVVSVVASSHYYMKSIMLLYSKDKIKHKAKAIPGAYVYTCLPMACVGVVVVVYALICKYILMMLDKIF
jgi:formate hydrogenlyase subunit 3/multisubunit Na+/H+ antiporter MnhD subunit